MFKVKFYTILFILFVALFDPALAASIAVIASGLIPVASDLGVAPGNVYVLKGGKYYKIGVTSASVEQRVKELQTGSENKISVAHVIPSVRPYALESRLHARFAHKRRRGEWFELSAYDLKKLREM